MHDAREGDFKDLNDTHVDVLDPNSTNVTVIEGHKLMGNTPIDRIVDQLNPNFILQCAVDEPLSIPISGNMGSMNDKSNPRVLVVPTLSFIWCSRTIIPQTYLVY